MLMTKTPKKNNLKMNSLDIEKIGNNSDLIETEDIENETNILKIESIQTLASNETENKKLEININKVRFLLSILVCFLSMFILLKRQYIKKKS